LFVGAVGRAGIARNVNLSGCAFVGHGDGNKLVFFFGYFELRRNSLVQQLVAGVESFNLRDAP